MFWCSSDANVNPKTDATEGSSVVPFWGGQGILPQKTAFEPLGMASSDLCVGAAIRATWES